MKKIVCILMLCIFAISTNAFCYTANEWKYERNGISGKISFKIENGETFLTREFSDGSCLNEKIIKTSTDTYVSATISGQYYIIHNNELRIYDEQGLVMTLDK